MSKAMITESLLTDIANAIRSKLGVETTYKPEEMASAISSISTGIVPSGSLSISKNGTYDVTEYASAVVKILGGSGAGLELLYETVIELEQSITTTTQTDIAVIQTGFTGKENEPRPGDTLLFVTVCERDTDADTSYVHFKARTQTASMNKGNFGSVAGSSGTVYNTENIYSGAVGGAYVFASSANLSSFTVRAKGHSTYGFAPSGSYRIKLFRISREVIGLDGII